MTTTTRRTSKSPLPRIATRSALTRRRTRDRPAAAARPPFTTPQVHSGEPSETITMRGVLTFRFPAHASLEVRKQVIARFVRETQAKIDQEQQVERELAAFRESLPAGLGLRRCNFTFDEAALQLGLTVAEVKRAVSMGALLTGTVGYVKVISESEIRRFKAGAGARTGWSFPAGAGAAEVLKVAVNAMAPANRTKKPKRVAAPAS